MKSNSAYILDICGEKHVIKEFGGFVGEPILENGSRKFCANYLVLQNTGNTIIEIDSGFNLYPTQALTMGNPNSLDMYVKEHTFRFAETSVDGEAIENRLQYIEYQVKNIPCLADYQPQTGF